MHIYKPKEFAEKVGVSVLTLQRWDNRGVLKAHRTPTNRRYYTDEELNLLNIKPQKEYYQSLLSSLDTPFVPMRDLCGEMLFYGNIINADNICIEIRGVEKITDRAVITVYRDSDRSDILCRSAEITHDALNSSVNTLIRRYQNEYKYR